MCKNRQIHHGFSSKIKKNLAISSIFIALSASAYYVRLAHFNTEMKKYGEFMPFTRESAMMFSYSLKVAQGNGIPLYDKGLIGLEGFKTSEQMSVGLEYFTGISYRLKNFITGTSRTRETDYEDDINFSIWTRNLMRLWISLVAGIIFIWLLGMDCNYFSAIGGGLLYAVAPAAVIRATGQILIREMFCIPFIVSCFMFYSWHLLKPSRIKLLLIGVFVYFSMAFWDMFQLCLGLWAIFEIFSMLFIDFKQIAKKRAIFLIIYISAVSASITIPYLKCHDSIFSPSIAILLPSLVLSSLIIRESFNLRVRALTILGTVLFFIVLKTLIGWGSFTANYSHFFPLLISKLRFLNVKPKNPSLLDFDSRVLWTPALHSATFNMTRFIFPVALLMFMIYLAFHFIKHKRLRAPKDSGLLVYFGIVFFIMYIFMVRFHVLCIIFLCPAISLCFNSIYNSLKNRWAKIILVASFLLTILAETDISMRLAETGGNFESEYHSETAGLIKWLRQISVRGNTILAAFELSPMLKAYCGANIVLQPKFELPQTRNTHREYINQLFHGTEKTFHDFCETKNIDLFVFDRGYAGKMHIYSSRYIAGAKTLDRKSPVYRMYHAEERKKLRGFYVIPPPDKLSHISNKYILFKVIKKEDHLKAMELIDKSREAIRNHNIMSACYFADKAFYLDPLDPKTRILQTEIHGKPGIIDSRKFSEFLHEQKER